MPWDFGEPTSAPDPVLQTLTVVTPGSFFVRNRGTAHLSLIFDNGAPPASLVARLVSNAVASPLSTFTGRIQIVGQTGSQFDATSS